MQHTYPHSNYQEACSCRAAAGAGRHSPHHTDTAVLFTQPHRRAALRCAALLLRRRQRVGGDCELDLLLEHPHLGACSAVKCEPNTVWAAGKAAAGCVGRSPRLQAGPGGGCLRAPLPAAVVTSAQRPLWLSIIALGLPSTCRCHPCPAPSAHRAPGA